MKNQVLAFLLSGAMVLSLSACTVTTKDDPSASAPPRQSEPAAPSPTVSVSAEPSVEAAVNVKPSAAPVSLESSGVLGEYTVEIKDFVLTKDYTKKPTIVITYAFTNNSDEATSAMVALSDTAYQNGVQLNSVVITDDAVYNSRSHSLDVKPGGTLDVQYAYSLSSETAPVEFELSELFSFSDEFLGKIFEIAPGGVTELAAIDVPTDAATGKIGDFEVSILSVSTGKDYKDNDCVTVVYGFKNNGTEAATFSASCSSNVYQDSVQLESAVISGSNLTDALSSLDDVLSTLTYVKPGAAILVSSSYLTTSTSDLEVEVTPLFSFNDDKVARTFSLG